MQSPSQLLSADDIYIIRFYSAMAEAQGALSGKAEKIDGGYIVNGSWKYATGASHASFFSVSCILTQNGELTKDKEGRYKTRSFIIPKHHATISGLWNSYGLKATASHNFKVEDVLVPDELSFSLTEPSMFADGPLYKFPFLQLAEVLLAVTMSGMAYHFIDVLEVLLKKKIQVDPNKKKDYTAISNSNLALTNARTELYKSVEDAWLRYEKGETASNEELKKITIEAKQCALVSRTEVESLYPWAGMDAIIPETDLNRIWRDIHTASQHILLSPFSN